MLFVAFANSTVEVIKERNLIRNCVYVPMIVCIYYNGDTVINETKNGTNYATNLIGRTGIEGRNQNGTTGFFVKDMHGDVRGAYTATGTELANYLYTAWGNVTNDLIAKSGLKIILLTVFILMNIKLIKVIG